ncbi:MAG: fibronectin type III domain-containing protein [Spirochaetia bacterium]
MRRKVVIAVTAAAVLLCAGCESLLDGLSDRPSNVEATDGEYRDRIEVTWDEVNTDGKDYSVDYYEIERRELVVNSNEWENWTEDWLDTGTDTSYADTSVVSGKAYQYRVRAVFDNGDSSFSSNSAEGYAMDATSLKVYSSPDEAEGEVDVAAGSWVEFPAQKGWIYTITTNATVDVYMLGNIRDAIHSESGTFTFTATKSEIHHIKVGGETTISVSY